MEKDFFVSYNKADEQWAKWIAAVLEANGCSCEIQAWDFRPGDNFVLKMQEALTKCERFIAVLSPNYMESKYCQPEWAAAFTKDSNSEKRTFIPVRVADIKPEGLFAAVIYIDLFGVDEKEAEKRLLKSVDIKDIPRKRPAYPGASPSPKKAGFPGKFPVHNLAFSRNEFYTECRGVLGEISKGFMAGNTVAITGMAGVGKTQTALAYAYDNAGKYDFIWWVNADSESSVSASYNDILKLLGVAGDEIIEHDRIIRMFLGWLDKNNNWLVIYDNADDVELDAEWMPRNANGHILITTRNPQLQQVSCIDIDPFTEDAAAKFFEKRIKIAGQTESAKKLAGRLGFLPLALEQAAAYISINRATTDYDKYLGLLERNGLRALEKTKGVINYKLPVKAALEISIKQIDREAAVQLLNLCAYLAPENIDPDLFDAMADSLTEPLKSEIKDEITRNELWNEELARYAILKFQNDYFFMHRLTQEVVIANIGEDKTWAECWLSVFNKIYDFEYGNAVSHNLFLWLSPHVLSFLDKVKYVLKGDGQQAEIAALYNESGFGNVNLGNYDEAFDLYNKSLEIRLRILGEDHQSTATSYNNIALVYSIQGEYQKALDFHNKSLEIRERILGEDHRDTAASYNNIAAVYSRQGDYRKALELYNKSLEISLKILGEDHPSTATSYNNIAMVYDKQGDYQKALDLYNKSLEISLKILGEDHPDTATSYNNIAGVYDRQGDYQKALDFHNKSLDIRLRILGEDHPDTADSYNNIALVYYKQGDYQKALELFIKSLEIRLRILGEDHPDTAASCNNIAYVYYEQGDYPESLAWFQKALPVFEKRLGPAHESTKRVKEMIAKIESLTGKEGD